jgi:CubicO group peptidase (beta-lactamase class C family)
MSDLTTRRAIEHATKIIDPWIEYKRTTARVPAVSVGIVHDDKVMFANGYGFADIARRIRASDTTCYRIASISKTITATAALQLAERGALQLDDRVQTFLPWFRSKMDPGLGRVTLRHLLTHMAGIERDGDTAHWEHRRFPTLEQIQDHVSEGVAVFRPLETFKYSNLGYAIAGQVIEAASGQPYERYVEEHIVRRLGLSRTSPTLTARVREKLAVGYGRDVPPAPRAPLMPHVETRAMASATGFTSNVLDLCAYMSAHFLGRGGLLSDESKREMQRVHWMNKRVDHHYGVGFDLWKVDGALVVGHGGGFPGFITRIAVDPERKIGVAVLTNALDPLSGILANGVLSTIYYFLKQPDQLRPSRRPASRLARYEGRFFSRWSDTQVAGAGGHLIAFIPALDRPTDEAVVLKHLRGHTFKITTGNEFGYLGENVVFEFGSRGRLTGLTWGPNRSRAAKTPRANTKRR